MARTDSGYRQYSEAEVHTLRFIKRSRDLGFLHEPRSPSWSACGRTAAAPVPASSASHNSMSTSWPLRIEAMQAMQRTLRQLLHHCQGDERPDCPILDDLAAADTPLPHRRAV